MYQTFCMYFTRIPNDSRYILGYTSDTSRYMYLLASYVSHYCHTGYTTRYIKIHQDTSRYMYLGLFVKIHQDTTGYKITIHVSWMRHDDTSRYIRDTSRYMYLGHFVRAALDTHKIRSRCNADTFKIYVSWARSICPAAQGAEGAPPLRHSSRAPLRARAEGLATVPFDCSP